MLHKFVFAMLLPSWHKPIATIAVPDQSENTAPPLEIVWTAQKVALLPKMQAGKRMQSDGWDSFGLDKSHCVDGRAVIQQNRKLV